MPIERRQLYCPTCRCIRRVDRNAPNNLLHLALTVLTGGVWLFMWGLASLLREPWRCSVCGRKVGGVVSVGGLVLLMLVVVWAVLCVHALMQLPLE